MKPDHAAASDAALVVAVGRYDEQALRELHRRHADAIFGLALRVLSDRGLAEDVLQDAFVGLWEHPERFDPERGSLRSYLLAVAHGRAVDRVRSEQARRDRERRQVSDQARTRPRADLEREAWDLITSSTVREAIDTLSATEREAILLAYFGGHTYREVASELGIPEGTAKSRIRLGLGKLADALDAAGLGAPA